MGICCMSQETQTGVLYHPRGVGREGDGKEFQKGGDMCIPMAYLCSGLTERTKFCKAIILWYKIN